MLSGCTPSEFPGGGGEMIVPLFFGWKKTFFQPASHNLFCPNQTGEPCPPGTPLPATVLSFTFFSFPIRVTLTGTITVKITTWSKRITAGEDTQQNRLSPQGIINILLQRAIGSSLLVLFTSKIAIFKTAQQGQFSLNWSSLTARNF